MQLFYSAASPYARVVRIVAAERDIALDQVEETSFPPVQVLADNPAMQVPVLVAGDGPLFGTRLIVEYLMSQPLGTRPSADFAASETRPDHHWQDAQVLVALETLLNSLVTRSYLIWTGARTDANAPIPIDLTERELARALRLLDWLDKRATPNGFVPEVLSLQDIWLIATLAWTEVRLQIPWRGRPNIEAIVARNEQRTSVLSTLPPLSTIVRQQ